MGGGEEECRRGGIYGRGNSGRRCSGGRREGESPGSILSILGGRAQDMGYIHYSGSLLCIPSILKCEIPRRKSSDGGRGRRKEEGGIKASSSKWGVSIQRIPPSCPCLL